MGPVGQGPGKLLGLEERKGRDRLDNGLFKDRERQLHSGLVSVLKFKVTGRSEVRKALRARLQEWRF